MHHTWDLIDDLLNEQDEVRMSHYMQAAQGRGIDREVALKELQDRLRTHEIELSPRYGIKRA